MLNLTLFQLCDRAGVDYRQVRRWQLKKVSPTIGKFGTAMRALEGKLAELEATVLEALTRQKGEAA